MFTTMTNRKRVQTSFRWLLRSAIDLIRLALGARSRFLLLSPPILARQRVYDMRHKRLINVCIRNIIDFYVVTQIFSSNDYGTEKLSREGDLNQFYEGILKSGKTPLIIDCGGNSGMATRFFAETYKESVIVLVEPDESNIGLARKNNEGKQVTFLLAGVGSTDTRARLHDPGMGNWAYQVEPSVDGDVQIVSINTLLDMYDPSVFTPFLIKIDIEGFEADLFAKNTDWIDRFPLLVIELHDRMLPKQNNSQSFLRAISERDRDFFFFGENVFSVSNSI